MSGCDNSDETSVESDQQSNDLGLTVEGTLSSNNCDANGTLEYLCGVKNPEDVHQIGSTDWILVSGMADMLFGNEAPLDSEVSSGHLYVVNQKNRLLSEIFPGDMPVLEQNTELFGACPGPLNINSFSAHGLSLQSQGGEQYRLYITSHGEREAIEIFDLNASNDEVKISWIGCVELPETGFFNGVAALNDGGFVTTKMMDTSTGFAGIGTGEITGMVYEWHPGGAVEAIEGTETSAANGIAISQDSRWLYVAAYGSMEVARYDLQASPIQKTSVSLDIRVDNLHWSYEGTLYAAGPNDMSAENCAAEPCAAGWSVYEIDPNSLRAKRIAGADDTPVLQGASAAIAVGENLWIGVPMGDRIGILPKP